MSIYLPKRILFSKEIRTTKDCCAEKLTSIAAREPGTGSGTGSGPWRGTVDTVSEHDDSMWTTAASPRGSLPPRGVSSAPEIVGNCASCNNTSQELFGPNTEKNFSKGLDSLCMENKCRKMTALFADSGSKAVETMSDATSDVVVEPYLPAMVPVCVPLTLAPRRGHYDAPSPRDPAPLAARAACRQQTCTTNKENNCCLKESFYSFRRLWPCQIKRVMVIEKFEN